MQPDYKEIWLAYYEEALDRGIGGDAAEAYATENATDRLAAMADDAHDRAKERDL